MDRIVVVATRDGLPVFSHVFWRADAAKACADFLSHERWAVLVLGDTRDPKPKD